MRKILYLFALFICTTSFFLFNSRFNNINAMDNSSMYTENGNLLSDSDMLTLHFTADKRLPFDPFSDWIAFDAFIKGIYGTLASVTPNGLWHTDSEDSLLNTIETENGDPSKIILGIKRGLYFEKDNIKIEFTSEDLKYSYSIPFLLEKEDIFEKGDLLKIKGMNKLLPGDKYDENKVTGITILNKYAIKIELDYPEPDFIKNLSTTKHPIVSKYFYENKKDGELTPGLGKYYFISADLSLGEAILKRKNPKKNYPNYIKFISSEDKNGDILLENLWGNTKENFREEIIHNSYGSFTMGLFFNYENNFGRNELFRKAINYAIKRKDLTDGFSFLIPNSEVLPHGFWGRIEVEEKQNISLAKEIISSIKNIPNPLIIKVYGQSDDELNKPYYVKLKKQLAEIGLNPIFKKDTGNDPNSIAIFIGGIVSHYKDPSLIFQYFVDGSFFTNAYPKDDENIKYYFNMLSTSYKDSERIYYAKELSKYFSEKNIIVPLWDFLRVFYINNKKIQTIGSQPGGTQFDIWKVRFRDKNDVEN